MELKELYQEIILDHAKNPRNKGKCEGFNHDAKAHNPLCGDKVHIYLKLDKDKNISGVVAYSSGNHAQGVSKAAQIFDMHAIIVMPEDAPQNKIDKTKANGAEVVLYKRHIESCLLYTSPSPRD